MSNAVDRYGVMGNPIAHSKSPIIHQQFANQTGQSISYEAILVELGDFERAVKVFQAEGGKGLNVTVPFKQDAWQLCDEKSDRAEHAGAVNTLLLDESGKIRGDNTDGIGIVRDLTVNHSVSLQGKNILILGAGGAVRGVLQPVLLEKPAHVTIANRTVSKAHDLAAMFQSMGEVSGCGFDELDEEFDIVINGTSASLQGDMPPIPDSVVNKQSACYDMMYAKEPTTFLRWASDLGVKKCMDGLGMLVEQAAESFYLWRGVKPETAAVIQYLKSL